MKAFKKFSLFENDEETLKMFEAIVILSRTDTTYKLLVVQKYFLNLLIFLESH